MRCFEPLQTLNRFFILLFIPFLLFAKGVIQLHDSFYKEPLFLKDIASIKAQNKNIEKFLKDLEVDKKYFKDFLITPKEVKSILKRNLILPSGLKITGKSFLFFKAEVLNRDSLEEIIRLFIKSRFENVKIKRVYISSKINFKDVSVLVQLSSKSFGHIYLNILVYKGKSFIKKIRANVSVDEFIKKPFAKRDILKGQIIRSSDIELKEVKKRSSNPKVLTINEIAGSVAKRNIYASKEIKPSYIEPNYDVKKRQNVKIIYNNGPIKIELLGLALDNGKRGDIIRVKNISTNKVLRCKVLSNYSVLFVR